MARHTTPTPPLPKPFLSPALAVAAVMYPDLPIKPPKPMHPRLPVKK